MDDMVRAAMAKWPHVPDCFGWLGLDARGDWYMRDEAAQAQGHKGSRLQHDKLIDFIGRNYAVDELGRWHFQNGPQRVYIELEVAPWVWRLQPDGQVHSHTRQATHVLTSHVDEVGHLWLVTQLGWGLVHTADMALAAERVDSGEWQPTEVSAAEVQCMGGFVLSPHQLQNGPKKNRP